MPRGSARSKIGGRILPCGKAMTYVATLYPWLLFLCAGLSISVPLLGWLRHRVWRSPSMILVAVGTATITIGAAATHLATTLPGAITSARLENVGYAILVPGWLIFSFRYLRMPSTLEKGLYALIALYSAATVLTAAGPPSSLTWSNPRFEAVSGVTRFIIEQGPLAWTLFSITVILSLLVMVVFLLASTGVHRYYRWRMRLVPIAMFVPFYAALHDSFLWAPFPGIRFIPLGFTFFSLVLYFVVVYQGLGDLVPIPRDLLLENLYEAIVVLDRQGRVVDLNSVTAMLAGVTQPAAIGQQLESLLPALDQKVSTLPDARALEFEIVLETGIGSRTFDVRCSPVVGGAGRTLGQVLVLQDVSERKSAEARMRFLALHDMLTGLPNRASLMDRIGQAIQRSRRRPEQGLALLFIDLDNFKLVNDQLGHSAGDQVLRDVAHRLSVVARASDTVARMGGDEFVVLLEEVGHAQDAQAAAERILACFQDPFEVDGAVLELRASVGLAYDLTASDSPDTYLTRADQAMYRAKALGGAQIVEYEPGLEWTPG